MIHTPNAVLPSAHNVRKRLAIVRAACQYPKRRVNAPLLSPATPPHHEIPDARRVGALPVLRSRAGSRRGRGPTQVHAAGRAHRTHDRPHRAPGRTGVVPTARHRTSVALIHLDTPRSAHAVRRGLHALRRRVRGSAHAPGPNAHHGYRTAERTDRRVVRIPLDAVATADALAYTHADGGRRDAHA